MGGGAPDAPESFDVKSTDEGIRVRWSVAKDSEATNFAIYRVSGPDFDPAELENGANLIMTLRAEGSLPNTGGRGRRHNVLLPAGVDGGYFTITALDRLWNESTPAPVRSI